MQFRYPADRSAGSLGRIRQCAGFTESTRVHGGGERLEIGLPGQVVVESFQSLGGAEQLRRGLGKSDAPVSPPRLRANSIWARNRAT